ncbi:unnamed protein product [Arctia plantaginis]|uniref:Carboxylesterase type B domain-containing protein n=1 Tax=Arctia plantaginis TaxID=874455 RepID=A0A8S1A8U3_ARCPL|nr:unnamed protein product [Arctia plantaginis]
MLAERCVILIFLVCTVNSEIKDLLVETDIGFIKGLRADDGDYTMFLGLPFAEVNTSNPFGVATPHPGFEKTFEAYDDYAPCPQREEYNLTLVGSLNCLKLNIFVPDSASAKNRLPVLAYVFGGGFTDGIFRFSYK